MGSWIEERIKEAEKKKNTLTGVDPITSAFFNGKINAFEEVASYLKIELQKELEKKDEMV